MAVHAHPDDESSKGAATMARYISEGVDVVVVTCTGGERGSILNPAMDRPDVIARLSEIRREEMERARQILGVRQKWLGFLDSGLPEGEPPPPLPDDCFAVQPLHDAAVMLGLDSPYAEWLANWVDKPEDADRLTTQVPCADWFDVRDRALLAHATQVDPKGRWFAVPLDVQRRAWPTEDYQLARSLVDTELPEDDLFAGIRESARPLPSS